MAVGRPRRYPVGQPPKLHNVKCFTDVFDLVRKICAARKLNQQEVMDKFAKRALVTEMHRIIREEYAAMKGEG
jgi:hypothetical protein